MAIWIAFEGGEATGKSTQAALLAKRLGAVLTREPGGTGVGERVRALLLDPSVVGLDSRAETLLMAADRAQHLVEIVGPALSAGRDVVSDRSGYSSIAYQGFGRGVGADEVARISSWATDGRWPDLVVLLDVSDEVRAARLATERPADRLEQAGDAFHRRVRDAFRAMAAADMQRWVVVDGDGSVDDVARSIADAVDEWVASRG